MAFNQDRDGSDTTDGRNLWQDPTPQPKAADPTQPTAPAPAPTPGVDPNRQRVLDALKAVNSTDDPEYWIGKIGNDPNGYGSAWDYWNDRIRRGNGSELVKNGSMQLFNDGGSNGANGQATPFGDFSKYFQAGRSGGILGNPSGVSDSLINMLTQRAQQSLSIDPNTDKIIKPQVDAAAATQERGRRNYLNDLAESSNPYATGAQQTAATQTSEAAGQNVSALQSSLVQNELNSRRQEIQSALQGMGGLLTADQQLSLQRQLDQVNSGLASQQIGNNFTLGMGNLDLGRQQLGSQNDQFAARMGFDTQDRASYWDALRRGLIKG